MVTMERPDVPPVTIDQWNEARTVCRRMMGENPPDPTVALLAHTMMVTHLCAEAGARPAAVLTAVYDWSAGAICL